MAERFKAKKLILEKGEIASPVFTEPIQLIFRISEVLRRSEKKRSQFEPIPGCNSYKKPDFSNLKVATISLKITVHLIL